MARGVSVAVALTLLVGCGPNGEGLLRWGQPLPPDVLAEIDTVERRFADAFDRRLECIPPAGLLLVAEVEGGDARYVAATRRIEIEIPTTPARFGESLVHELAHHVEATCDAFEDLRDHLRPLLADAGQRWNEGATWEETPAELWAEIVVQIVLGERLLHADDMPLPPGAVATVEAWLAE